MASKTLEAGDIVLSADGSQLGFIAEVSDTCFRMGTKRKRGYWLPQDAVLNRDGGIVLLTVDKKHLSEALPDVVSHAGQHSHPKPASSGMSMRAPLMLMVSLAGWAMRNPETRKMIISGAKEARARVKTRMAARKRSSDNMGLLDFQGTSTLSSDPAIRAEEIQLRLREEALVRRVNLAFPDRSLQVAAVPAYAQGGSDDEALRFTLDGIASTEIELSRLEPSNESESTIADEVISKLRMQLAAERDL